MNSAHCPQCGRTVSAVDRAGGSCPWCGRVLSNYIGQTAKPTRHRHTPVTRTSSSSSGGGTSAWSYWWIPLVALGLLRGIGTCNRNYDRPSSNLHDFQYTPPREFDKARFQEVIDRVRQDEARWQELQSDQDPDNDDAVRRPGEAARRLFGVTTGDDEAATELDEDNTFDNPLVGDALRRQREALDRSNFPRTPTTTIRVPPEPTPKPRLPDAGRYSPRSPAPPSAPFRSPSPPPQRSFP